jgi:ribonuclease HI
MIKIRKRAAPASCILIHTDGSCLGNPGPGGWAASLRCIEGGHEVKKLVVFGSDPDTTNNRMELTAALEAIRRLRRDEAAPVIIRSDSKYLIEGMTEWAPGWAARGWRRADGRPVANQDLWEALQSQPMPHALSWEWVRAHSGDTHNAEVDLIANVQAQTHRQVS